MSFVPLFSIVIKKEKPTKDFLPPTTEAITAVPAARSRMVICHEDDGDGQDDSDDTV